MHHDSAECRAGGLVGGEIGGGGALSIAEGAVGAGGEQGTNHRRMGLGGRQVQCRGRGCVAKVERRACTHERLP